nr:alpha/beta fold hydrolase [Ardenticatenales bacterium]
MRPYHFLILILILLAACSTNATSRAGTIDLKECHLSAPGLPLRLPAKCGTLTLFENRATQSGRQITLNIAVVPARGRDVEPDPLVFLAGGPGQAATESYVQISTAFDRINRDRDIVLVDQRGTGHSNALRCEPAETTTEPAKVVFDEAQQAEEIKACLAQLNADPTLYTTAIAMDDLDAVRAALGYERVN